MTGMWHDGGIRELQYDLEMAYFKGRDIAPVHDFNLL